LPPALPFAELQSQVRAALTLKRKREEDPVAEVPENANLTYFIDVKDSQSKEDLATEMYRHTDNAIAQGNCYSSLKSRFAETGHANSAVIMMTPYGPRLIFSDDDWNATVLSIYNQRRMRGNIDVEIYI
jgi:hypothetical protein